MAELWYATLNDDTVTHHVDTPRQRVAWCGQPIDRTSGVPRAGTTMCGRCLKLRTTRGRTVGDCPVCGHTTMLRHGLVPRHHQRRVRLGGPYIAGDTCPGGGQPPDAPAGEVA